MAEYTVTRKLREQIMRQARLVFELKERVKELEDHFADATRYFYKNDRDRLKAVLERVMKLEEPK